jgi:tetratricopeptide (TPR) repeat protein
MKCKVALGCMILALVGRAANASTLDDCLQGSQAATRIPACTEIINNANYSVDEKATAYRSRGQAHADAGADRMALDDFNSSIGLRNDNAASFAGRARAEFALRNFNAAIADFGQAISLTPNSDFYVERGHIYTVMNNADAAIPDFTEALRLVPTDWSAFNERGMANAQKGDFSGAEGNRAAAQRYYSAGFDDYSAAIAIFPHPVFFSNRGHLLESWGKTQDAIKDYQRAVQGDASLVDARRSLDRLGAKAPIADDTENRIREGAALAEKNCSTCHTLRPTSVGMGKNAPAFRDIYQKHQLYALRQPVTQAILAVHEKMPQFKVSPQELDAVVAYINSINGR